MSIILRDGVTALINNRELSEPELEHRLEKLLAKEIGDSVLQKKSSPVSKLVSETLQAAKTASNQIALASGFKDFDETFGGFNAGEFVIIGGRPTMGKSQLLVNLCLSISQQVPALFFTYDLSEQLLIYRMMSTLTEIPLNAILQNRMTEEQNKKMSAVEKEFASRDIYVNDAYSHALHNFREECTRQVSSNGVRVIFVDYLQLMGSGRHRYNREAEVSFVSRELKTIARELNVVLIAASQLSRAIESRSGGRDPLLSDLRDSGALEQDADKVIFIYRPGYYDRPADWEEEPPGRLELTLLKNRTGKTGRISLCWNETLTSIGDLWSNEPRFNFSENRLDEMDESPF